MSRLIILITLLWALPVHADQMIVFGDSLSDGGYYLGLRFTDPGGLLWHEYLADEIGYSRATTSSFGFSGLNLAVSASRVSDLQDQVNRYNNRYSWVPGDLCALWIGGNDLRDDPTQNMTLLASQIGDIITQLAALGVDHFIVPNLPDLGAIPEVGNNATLAAARRNGTIAFNTALAAELDDLASALDINIHKLDVFTLFDQMLFYTADYGFTNISDPLDGSGGVPSEYAFWDRIHPTTHSHDLINLAGRTVVDPSTPIELISQSIEPDLSHRQTWLANPDLTYRIISGSDLDNMTEAASYTGSPAHTIAVPAPGPERGFYQTRTAP